MSNPRLIALNAFMKIEYDYAYSNIVLGNLFKEYKLDFKDKSFISALIYGVIERKIEIDYLISLYSTIKIKKISKINLSILRFGIYQIIYMDKIPNSAAINESVKLVKKKKQIKSVGFVNAILRAVDKNSNNIPMPNYKKDMIKYLSIKNSCPEWLLNFWINAYGKEISLEIIKSFNDIPSVMIRVNTLKNTSEELIEILKKEKIIATKSLIENALEIKHFESIFESNSFKQGRFIVQDLSSQICCEILNPLENQVVIDVCAAPGGKTFNIAQRMKNKGKILAFDIYEHRINLIKNAAKKLKINIIQAIVKDSQKENKNFILADRVLCDVPCSGLGIIKRKPEIKYRDQSVINNFSDIQYNILCNSKKLVKLSGLLVYSTCTLNPKENSFIANRFLEENKDYESSEIVLPKRLKRYIDEPNNQLTLFPNTNQTDGFFIAKFKRKN